MQNTTWNFISSKTLLFLLPFFSKKNRIENLATVCFHSFDTERYIINSQIKWKKKKNNQEMRLFCSWTDWKLNNHQHKNLLFSLWKYVNSKEHAFDCVCCYCLNKKKSIRFHSFDKKNPIYSSSVRKKLFCGMNIECGWWFAFSCTINVICFMGLFSSSALFKILLDFIQTNDLWLNKYGKWKWVEFDVRF